MQDNMLVNVSGLKGHSMPIDLNIEHLIGELKVYLNHVLILCLGIKLGITEITFGQRSSIDVGSPWKYICSNRLP